MSLITSLNELFIKGNETEIRLGRMICGSFQAGLPFLSFAKMLELLKQASEPTYVGIQQVDYLKDKRRLTIEPKTKREIYITKGRRTVHDFQGVGLAFDVRASSMTETLIPMSEGARFEMTNSPDMTRSKDRARFQFEGFHIDLTVVNTTRCAFPPSGDLEKNSTTYEVEIEIQDKEAIDEAASWVFRLLKCVGETAHPSPVFRRV